MDRAEYKKEILKARKILTLFPKINNKPSDHVSDQEAGIPMPSRVKENMTENIIDLPTFDSTLLADNDFLSVAGRRKTHRVFTEEKITLKQLSYMLWCTQGMREVPENAVRSSRTVAGGGGRHEFEMYMIVQHAEDIKPGIYHYLPRSHQIEFIKEDDILRDLIVAACGNQKWTAAASVVFVLTAVAYRMEWRYGVYSHPLILMDAGHVSENMYLAATSLDLGCCAVARIGMESVNAIFRLDSDEEIPVMAFAIGTI